MKTSCKKSSAEVTASLCQQVTDKLVALMEQGVNPWRCPWSGGSCDEAISHTTGKPYSFLNQMLLGFKPGEYLTITQIKAEGGMVKKGAKSQIIVYWVTGYHKLINDEEENGEPFKKVWVSYHSPILKSYRVFHIDDTTDINPRYATKTAETINHTTPPIEAAESAANGYCERSGVTLRIEDSNRAYYSPSNDLVVVPLREQFDNIEKFYSTLFHELGHSTGHASRLDRFKPGENMFSGGYSRGELVAEICSATCLSRLGINSEESDTNSAAYLQHWASFLKSDPKAIVVAAGRAEKAVRMIFSGQPHE